MQDLGRLATDGGKMHRLADRVSWIGTLSSSSISPTWSTLWTTQREAASEGESGGDDETLPACHTPQSTPNRDLDCSRPLSCRDVSVKVSLMLMASPAPPLCCRDRPRLR
ncbi:hypothetical protein ABVT39_022299 [Epinephelus coioides]